MLAQLIQKKGEGEGNYRAVYLQGSCTLLIRLRESALVEYPEVLKALCFYLCRLLIESAFEFALQTP